MKIAQESIFSTSIRAFFIALFTVVGIGVGVVPVLALAGVFAFSSGNDLPTTQKAVVIPNHDGSRRSLDQISPVILCLPIEGIIGTGDASADSVEVRLQESREGLFKKDRVKGILIYFNTPGGAANDADRIQRALKEYKDRYNVPVYAYVDGMCASGGMWVASTADKILASELSIIGSIGVRILPFFNFSESLSRLGVQSLSISSGKNKDMLNPVRPWVDGEGADLQDISDYMYKYFIKLMVSNRPQIDKSKLVQEYGARSFIATEALEYGFIDEITHNFSSAVKKLADDLNLTKKDYQVVKLETHRWMGGFVGESSPLVSGALEHQIKFDSKNNSFIEF